MATDAFSEQRMPAQPLTLDPTRTAVIVVDMVNEFFEPGGKMVLAGGTALYAPVNALLDAAHQAHLPVLYTNQWLRPDDALFKKRIPHCLMDTWGAQLVDALHRAPTDIVVPKRRYSAFFGTDLDLLLRERTIATVIVTGVVTNICVRSTVHDAFFLGYEVVVPVECVAATTPQAQATSLYDIDTHYGTVAPLGQILGSCQPIERHPGQTMRSMRPAIERVMPRAPLQRVVAPLAIAIERGPINPSGGCMPAGRLWPHVADCP